jgi:hypothetical protein
MEAEEQEQHEFKKNLSPTTLMALPFLALNRYDRLFFILYMFIAIALLAYKKTLYPLPSYALATEGILLAMLSLTQWLRYHLAERAVAEKEGKMVAVYLIATVFVILSLAFELQLQTYVLLAEIVTGWAGIGLAAAEIVCGLWVLKVLLHKKRGR